MGEQAWEEEDIGAAVKLLGECVAWIPQGYLHDIVRMVAQDGRRPSDAWEALQEMLRT